MFHFAVHINRKTIKSELRRIGANLISASCIGGFITHITDLNLLAVVLLLTLGSIGIGLLFYGAYKVEE